MANVAVHVAQRVGPDNFWHGHFVTMGDVCSDRRGVMLESNLAELQRGRDDLVILTKEDLVAAAEPKGAAAQRTVNYVVGSGDAFHSASEVLGIVFARGVHHRDVLEQVISDVRVSVEPRTPIEGVEHAMEMELGFQGSTLLAVQTNRPEKERLPPVEKSATDRTFTMSIASGPKLLPHVFGSAGSQAGLAILSEGNITVFSNAHNPHDVRDKASYLGVDIEVAPLPFGGSFGLGNLPFADLFLALGTQKISKSGYAPEESAVHLPMTLPYAGPGGTLETEVTYSSDGRIKTYDVSGHFDWGSSFAIQRILAESGEIIDGVLRTPHTRFQNLAWRTSAPFFTHSVRGVGFEHGTRAMNAAVRQIAGALQKPIVEVWRTNLAHASALAVVDAAEGTYNRWRGEVPSVKEKDGSPILSAVGFGLTWMRSDFPQSPYSMTARIVPDGTRFGVEIEASFVDIGTGAELAFVEIFRDLGFNVDDRDVTLVTPTSQGADIGHRGSSRATPVLYEAVQRIVLEIKSRLNELDEFALQRDGRLTHRGQSVSVSQALETLDADSVARARLLEPVQVEGVNEKSHQVSEENATFMAVVSHVAVCKDTGVITVERVKAFVDPGKVLNKDRVVGQVQGGIRQAIEGLLYHHAEVMNPADHYARAADIPEIDVEIVQSGFQGVKGVGEVGIGADASLYLAIGEILGGPPPEVPIRHTWVFDHLNGRTTP